MTKKIKDDKRFFLVDVYYLEMLTAVSTLKRCEDRLSDMGTRMDITNIKIAEIRGGGVRWQTTH